MVRWGDIFGDDDDDDVGVTKPVSLDEQQQRRGSMLETMLMMSEASKRAAYWVEEIISNNEERMKLDKDGRLLITGHLAFYRVNINAFLSKFNNPFDYNSFDSVEVHPKSGLVESPKTACVQIRTSGAMPAYDFLGGYILGLMNDSASWLEENMHPLRRTLFDIYGMSRSPLTESLSRYLAQSVGGVFNWQEDTFTFNGTNGWKWRINFANPLAQGYEIKYQKPRQSWWNLMFSDHTKETTGHHTMSGFFGLVEHLSEAPKFLRTASEWETDPIFIREVASVYPPLAKVLIHRIDAEDYSADRIYSFYDEPIESDEAVRVSILDDIIRQTVWA
ncbi:MAG: hypothetical protein ISP83_02175 [Candidatus Poseidonia sp.]|nr:hypothetical protein [Poseidonia sp.]MBL6747385.1 hypothetical protein [Poseidonia sp.]MBL6806717.1 hypothetical protein [Poseidonia sp.]MBL6885865.1 hypothetical protein [Poseidonia sp.]MBL6892241.1 hypothetical protein [Poseidonia sp.]